MNLFLSRLSLNSRSRQVISETTQPYEMHRTLMKAFPDMEKSDPTNVREKLKVLFRTENSSQKNEVLVYVQSAVEPDWSFLERLDGYLASPDGHEYKDIMPLLLNIKRGQTLSFRLRANPTRRVAADDDHMKGKRVELLHEEQQIDWLNRKGRMQESGLGGGFEIVFHEMTTHDNQTILTPKLKVIPEGKTYNSKRVGDSRCSTTHFTVLFEGLLEVTDPNAFIRTICRGVGPAKAFGCGLMSVAPVSCKR